MNKEYIVRLGKIAGNIITERKMEKLLEGKELLDGVGFSGLWYAGVSPKKWDGTLVFYIEDKVIYITRKYMKEVLKAVEKV